MHAAGVGENVFGCAKGADFSGCIFISGLCVSVAFVI